MFLGSWNAGLIPFAAFLISSGSIIACYVISQIYHHEEPFPDTWISATADHYPEFVVFRVGTISGSVLLALSNFIIYYWVMTLAHESTFDIGKYRPQIGAVFGIGGALFLMGSTANLDTGKQNGDWHVFCAGNFFAWTIFSGWYHTFLSWALYSNTKTVSLKMTLIKTALSLAILVQLIWDLSLKSMSLEEGVGDRMGNILEYTASFSSLANYLIMAVDLKDFRLQYKQKRRKVQ